MAKKKKKAGKARKKKKSRKASGKKKSRKASGKKKSRKASGKRKAGRKVVNAGKEVKETRRGGERRYQLENLLDLVELLQRINDECALEGKWEYRLFIFPVYLDDALFFLGCQYGRVYITRHRGGDGLRKPLARDVLAKYYGRTPVLVLGDWFLSYDFCSSDTFDEKYREESDPEAVSKIEGVVQAFIEEKKAERESGERAA
ncbi:MAG: hypothetical protein ACTSU5_21555, partial [Promethearchaeota archaeon]